MYCIREFWVFFIYETQNILKTEITTPCIFQKSLNPVDQFVLRYLYLYLTILVAYYLKCQLYKTKLIEGQNLCSLSMICTNPMELNVDEVHVMFI